MKGNYRAIIIDDEISNLESLERILTSDGAEVHAFTRGEKALEFLNAESADVVITDLRMMGLGGMEFLEVARFQDPSLEIILVTAYGTVEVAVEAMKKGAYDFITKPLQKVHVLRAVRRALEKRNLSRENLLLRAQLREQLQSEGKELVGKSRAIRDVMDIASQAAKSRANVFIEGASGTGKGLLAEYIHRQSENLTGPFVKINCSAIPENLLEAELFGYEPGAFTGAQKRKKGRLELAEGGTLFLDEIGIAPGAFQTKLLRFLQEGEFERLGGNETHRVQARVIAATNVDLRRSIQSGQFREDLFYRLNVIHLHLPALKDRSEDIPLLCQKFIEDAAKRNGRPIPILAAEALDRLVLYEWPGNIRELQNLMERMVILNKTGTLSCEDLPTEIVGIHRQRSIAIPLGMSLKEAGKRIMEETLRETHGDRRLAAQLLGVHQRTLYRNLENISEEKS